MIDIVSRVNEIKNLFNLLVCTDSRTLKESLVKDFKSKHPDLVEDLDFCFEVLAGKHKLGYTYVLSKNNGTASVAYYYYTIKQFYKDVLQTLPATDEGILMASAKTPNEINGFICLLANRQFKLGYSNKEQMITSYSPMLAKKYQDSYKEQYYYVQEKLDGNRCIAYYDGDKYRFMSRSGKELKVNFDMDWVRKWADAVMIGSDIPKMIQYPTFDGEIMTLEHAGSRDFNRTSGAINGKYTDKSGLHYFIYDIVAPEMKYEERKKILDSITNTGNDCQILPVLDKVYVYPNHDYNSKLDEWLDYIVDKGGEGVMLRDPNGYYQCGKRSDGLLKYKKTQTMDLRIIDFNYGNGKYEGAIGSFYCESDDGKYKVNVSGMPDEIHFGNPADYMGRIIEVAYFDVSQGKDNEHFSLRFPRLKKFRDDKNETSEY